MSLMHARALPIAGRAITAGLLGWALSVAQAQPAAPASSRTDGEEPPSPVMTVPLVQPNTVCQSMPPPEMPAAALREGRSGWVLVEGMMDRTGITQVRVLRERGGRGFGAAAIAAVRGYQCAATEAKPQIRFRQEFVFRIEDSPPPALQEGFGLHAFESGAGARLGFIEQMAFGGCPVRAKLLLKRHRGEPNAVLDAGRITDPRVLEWLGTLVPRTDYMIPNPAGNWVEFRCLEKDGRLFLQ
ncbi:TonB family protein [Piscinibacter terrae]|uniref:TonB family protein n=1 Tax=Piscinibacter terrae TaxID=2496871 RepID=A0A3N7IU09_9BURK|nr:TonB family protein [Albitalea terrae]RQP22322.1 TonB family protein [Albitalea terrae]